MHTKWFRTSTAWTSIFALVVLSALTGCANSRSVAPLTAESGAVPLPGKFVWYDLLTRDLPGAKRFYGELLGWTFVDTDFPHYTLIEHAGRPIGGIVDVSSKGTDINESQWVSLLSVHDVDAATRATRDAGGEVHIMPTDLAGRGRLAVVSDPQGALIGYVRASGGDPPDRDAALGDWLWTELWTGDVDEASSFYGDLVSYEVDEETILEDTRYVFFRRGETPRAGVIVNPHENVRAHWLPYVRVEDPVDLVSRVEGLGGKVVLPPDDEHREGSVAIVVDPSGACLALQKWTKS